MEFVTKTPPNIMASMIGDVLASSGIAITYEQQDKVYCLLVRLLTKRAADGASMRRADENACQKAVDQTKLRLGPPRR